MKMEMFLLLIMVKFASERKENDAENLILVKIEEDEYAKRKTSQYIGVFHGKEKTSWQASRRSKNEKKMVYNGTYKDEEAAAHASDTLAKKLMKNGEQNHKLNFPDDNTEVNAEEKKISEYIGVSYHGSKARWRAQRWSKMEKKTVVNGQYKNENTAAHASDTLARKLMANEEQNHKLNFPDDNTEVHPQEETTSSIYIGVSKKKKLWSVQRRSKREKKCIQNGSYKNEETAAHASDTLARKLMANGEQNHKLNFPDDDIEVIAEEKNHTFSNYFGVSYIEKYSRWRPQRWSKKEKKMVFNECYKDEETAAHASDSLARKLMGNGEQGHKLNFPDDETERQANKRKRSENEDLGQSQNK